MVVNYHKIDFDEYIQKIFERLISTSIDEVKNNKEDISKVCICDVEVVDVFAEYDEKSDKDNVCCHFYPKMLDKFGLTFPMSILTGSIQLPFYY